MPTQRRALLYAMSLLLLTVAASGAGRNKMRDNTTQHHEEWLQAGPVRLKFCDGELRYLYVGDKEIVRRVYFAVRDNQWNTPLPQFSKMTVEKGEKSFTVHLEATCRSEKTDYHWKGEITGTADGTIRFAASGAGGRDFKSNRIGICLLYGAPAVLGQAFELVDGDTLRMGTFTPNVSPELTIYKQFQTLRYTTANRMTVAATIEGTKFDMEDQRFFGDCSFKAYAPLPYSYPNIPKDLEKAETFTLKVEKAPNVPPSDKVTHIALGNLLPNTVVPKIALAGPELPGSVFGDVNSKREASKNAKTLTWGMNPSTHLHDDDTFMENIVAIVDQARTAKEFAPEAKIYVAPVRLDSTNWQPGRDARGAALFGAAWVTRAVKYLALAGAEEAAFDFGPGYAQDALTELRVFVGKPLYDVTVHTMGYAPVDALAIDDNGSTLLWLINKTNHPQTAVVENLKQARGEMHRTDGKTPAGTPPKSELVKIGEGRISLELRPYEVCAIRLPAR